jgi:transcriptional regulator GlxA family with amidase domain
VPVIANRPIASIGFLLIPGFSLMSYAASIEPLRAANQIAQKTVYRWWHAAPGDAPAIASNGAAILPDRKLAADADLPDVLFVCAGGNPATFRDRRIFAWLRRMASRGVVIGGVSGGPFILARAGLLNGRRCTVHWEHMPAFRETFPDIKLTRSLFELDGDRLTCSGGVAALDMMIALMTQDHGYLLASAVSDWFLHGSMRESSRPQRMDTRFQFGVSDEKLLLVLRAIEADLEKPLSRQELADLAGMSVRQLERSFRRWLGRGIHEHYLSVRLTRARQLLRETSLSVVDVALSTGFHSASQFARAYKRVHGTTPRESRPMAMRRGS